MSTHCRICGSQRLRTLFRRPDTYFWHGPDDASLRGVLRPNRLDAAIEICDECGFMGLPLTAELLRLLDAYYTSEHAMPGTTHGTGNIFAEARTRAFFDSLAALGLGEMPARVLEVGCQQGFLLTQFHARGSEVCVGVEPGEVEPCEAPDGYRPEVRSGYLSPELLGGDVFDFAYSLQVFEHVTDPNGFLQAVHGALAPGGLLMLAVPNEEYALRLGNPGMFVFQHVNLFTPALLESILAANGFTVRAMLSHREKPLSVLAEKVDRRTDPKNPSLAEAGRALLEGYGPAVDGRLDLVRRVLASAPRGRGGLWGVNAAMANVFSWAPDVAKSEPRVFDTDPNKQGRVFGGVPGTVLGPDAAADVEALAVVPFMANRPIIESLFARPGLRARVHGIYEDTMHLGAGLPGGSD